MSELEILANSGFMSIVGLSKFQYGKNKLEMSLPQQPTTNLMVI